jgi:ParB/RepB/Spo0J family partition protein
MKIELSQIRPSPKPIRNKFDEEGMNNLKWSLMEQGQVEPIGIHKNHDGYVLVWGHRRTEAARRAGWDEIEAVIVEENEIDNLIQAGIENLAGEDMTVDEKAEWAFRLTEMGLTISEISRRTSVNRITIGNWLRYKEEKEQGVGFKTISKESDESMIKTTFIRGILGDDIEAKKAVAQKIDNENIGQTLTREVAKAYKQAPSPEIKQAVLDTPITRQDTQEKILQRATEAVRQQGVAFSWYHDIRVSNMLDAHRAIQIGIETLKIAKKEVNAARLILKQERDYLLTYVKRIDEILGEQNG